MASLKSKTVPTVAINRKGKKVIINETDFAKGKMKYWSKKDDDKIANAAKVEAAKPVVEEKVEEKVEVDEKKK